MLNSVTPWTATVQQDIQDSEPLFSFDLSGYLLQIFNSGDSIWLTTQWPSAGSIAFRLAFGMNSTFDKVKVNKVSDGILITGSTRLGNYNINISFPEDKVTALRYTTTLQVAFPLLIPFWPRDIVPLTKEGRVENTAGVIHTHQEGTRSGQIYFSMTNPHNGSVFYFQNLTAMSGYCEATQTSLAETVGGQWPEIGFGLPVNREKPLPSDKEFIISDAFVIFSDTIPESDSEIAGQFLDYLSKIYLMLPKPESKTHNWPELAEKTISDIYLNKGCWTQTNGNPFLNAYVGDYKTPAEIMVQLAVKLPLAEYLNWKGETHPLYEDLNAGLEDFYDAQLKTMVRWHPSLEKDLDKSEEQKQEMVMDSWYLHHPLANLGRLALMGSESDKKLFLDSIGFAIKVAHHFNYDWPVFYKMTTLEVIKAETSPGKGGEKDVPGSYAHVMFIAWQLTKDQYYLNEAYRAVKNLHGLVFDIFYQANNTTFAAATLIELYKINKDERFLNLSYCCLAGIFRNVQLWDCNYGHGKNFPGFFSVFPLNDAPYTAAYEEFEVYAGVLRYIQEAKDIELPESLQVLLPEFIKYAVGRLAYYYPAMLPKEMISEEVKTGEIQQNLCVPLEDIYTGWDKSGQVGQEVYGAGLPFGIIPRQYIKLNDSGGMVFIDYPYTKLRTTERGATFHIIGNCRLNARIKLLGFPAKKEITVEAKEKSTYRKVTPVDKKGREYELPCGILVRLSW